MNCQAQITKNTGINDLIYRSFDVHILAGKYRLI
jgi:hypothetical protein